MVSVVTAVVSEGMDEKKKGVGGGGGGGKWGKGQMLTGAGDTAGCAGMLPLVKYWRERELYKITQTHALNQLKPLSLHTSPITKPLNSIITQHMLYMFVKSIYIYISTSTRP